MAGRLKLSERIAYLHLLAQLETKPVVGSAGFQGADLQKRYTAHGRVNSLSEIAIWNNYGTEYPPGRVHTPPRPFMTQGVMAFAAKFRGTKKLRAAFVAAKPPEDLAVDMTHVLARAIHRALQTTAQWAAPISPAQAKKKGHTLPLHETEQLATSITFAVNGQERGRM